MPAVHRTRAEAHRPKISRSGRAATAARGSLVAQHPAAAAHEARVDPAVAARGTWGIRCGSCREMAAVWQCCHLPVPPCLLRQNAGMPVCNRKGLKTTKSPRQLCFSAALLMTRWPPVNTMRSKGGYKGHVTRTQLPNFKEKCKNMHR